MPILNKIFLQNANFAMKYKTLIKKLITKLYKPISTNKNGLRVFMYHSVIESTKNLDNLYVLNSNIFKEQMAFLNSWACRKITPCGDMSALNSTPAHFVRGSRESTLTPVTT